MTQAKIMQQRLNQDFLSVHSGGVDPSCSPPVASCCSAILLQFGDNGRCSVGLVQSDLELASPGSVFATGCFSAAVPVRAHS